MMREGIISCRLIAQFQKTITRIVKQFVFYSHKITFFLVLSLAHCDVCSPCATVIGDCVN